MTEIINESVVTEFLSRFTEKTVIKEKKKDISHLLLDYKGRLILRSFEFYKKLDWDTFRQFCHFYARYGIVTEELITFLKEQIKDRSCIEIGSGAGDLGYHLKIKMTDSKHQSEEKSKILYDIAKQPLIKYPTSVEKIDALEAVKKYQPRVVIGMWVSTYAPFKTTYPSLYNGVREEEILDLCETLILIGNLDQHGQKPILNKPHTFITAPWLVSRAKDQSKNCIMIWNNK